ncbi:MAG: hypothetical protein D9N11_14430 [Ketobacter sp.]|nr:MAG: hypothetical protein D9N11_14430 [Ketobacter sp.]
MRWIVLFLLIVNVAYFGWEFAYQSSPAVVAEAKSLPPLEGKKLVLLTERLPGAKSSAPPPAPVIAKEQSPVYRELDRVDVKKQAMCVSVGPYEDESLGRAMIKNLAVEGVASELDQLELSKEMQYWVILPPSPTRKEAMQLLRNLQAKKIDSYLISSGELRNSISLGLFSKKQSAQGVMASVKEAGFPAELVEKERVRSEFWVRIQPGQPVENLEETLETLVVQGGDIKISKAACEMFAQTK